MKKIIVLLSIFLSLGCSSVKLIDSWKNPETPIFKPQKLLVVGVTQNLTSRKIFEENLKREFLDRNINAIESSVVFESTFTDSKKSEEEIDKMVSELSEKGFDAVIITAVKGVEERSSYDPGYYTIGYHWRRFGKYYYRFQDIYYNPGYYNEYKVYDVETSIYNLNKDENKSLVWVGAFQIVNPKTITKTVQEYVGAIINQLENRGIIPQR
jgi:hypothetical protein